jgi:hypothetical protein
MDNSISVGDLVMVVRGHSCHVENMGGVPYVVVDFKNPIGGGWTCPKCGMVSAGPDEPCAMGNMFGRRSGAPISWLKKIPPLSEPESIVERLTVNA